jgi:hypothetical protein
LLILINYGNITLELDFLLQNGREKEGKKARKQDGEKKVKELKKVSKRTEKDRTEPNKMGKKKRKKERKLTNPPHNTQKQYHHRDPHHINPMIAIDPEDDASDALLPWPPAPPPPA